MMTVKKLLVVAGAATALAAGTADAQLTFFGQDLDGRVNRRAGSAGTDAARNLFVSQLVGSVLTEDFESQTNGSTPPIELDFGPVAATLNPAGVTGHVASQGGVTSTNGFGRYANSGSNYYETRSTRNVNTTFAINFSNPLAAFGFVGIDIGDFGSLLSLVFSREGSTVFTYNLPYTASNGTNSRRDGSRLFAGIIAQNDAQLFDRVEFRGTDRDDYFAFDDLMIAQPVTAPEPATVGLLGAGLAAIALGAARRRRS